MKNLSQISINKKVKIIKILGQGAIRRRIMDMGLTKSTEIFISKVAPFGDPIEVFVRGYNLTLRKDDAKEILVEELEEEI